MALLAPALALAILVSQVVALEVPLLVVAEPGIVVLVIDAVVPVSQSVRRPMVLVLPAVLVRLVPALGRDTHST